MASFNKMWKDHKHKTKTNYFVPNKADPDLENKVPKTMLPDQWKLLVKYWLSKDAMDVSVRNTGNRWQRGPMHTTGRTPFSEIRHKLISKGMEEDKMTVFLATRDPNDVDMKEMKDEYDRRVAELPENLRTRDAQNKIYHDLVGKDGLGYCRTYGAGVHPSMVYGPKTRSSLAPSSSTMDEMRNTMTREIKQRVTEEMKETMTREIEQRVTAEIERKMTSEFQANLFPRIKQYFQQMGAQMDPFGAQEGFNVSTNVSEALSGHQVRQSMEGGFMDDGDDGLQRHIPPRSPRPNDQVVEFDLEYEL